MVSPSDKMESMDKFGKFVGLMKRLCGLGQGSRSSFMVIVASAAGIIAAFAVLQFLAIGGASPFDDSHLDVYTGFLPLPPIPDDEGFYILWIGCAILIGVLFLYVTYLFVSVAGEGQAIESPPIFTPTVFVTMALGVGIGIIWQFSLASENLGIALFSLSITVVSFLIATGMLAYRFEFYREDLLDEERAFEYVMGFVSVNAIGMCTAWFFYLDNINLGLVLTASIGSAAMGSFIMQFSFGIFSAVYFILDVSFLERYTRFLFSPYIVMVVGLLYALDLFLDETYAPSIFNAAFFGVTAVSALAKVAVSFYNHNRERRAKNKKPKSVDYTLLTPSEDIIKPLKV